MSSLSLGRVGRMVAVGLCFVAGASRAQPPGLDEAAEFRGMRERWAAAMDEFDVPGMAVAIVRDGRVLAIETFGVRAPADGGGPPPTADTMFYLASITKTYLATAVCALADDGALSLDDPVRKHLPRFELAGPSAVSPDKITIRDLLCHGAGLGGGGAISVLDSFTGEITEDRYYRWLSKRRGRGQVGYSNIHYTLLGRVVEAASGKPWGAYLDERVLGPAGLTRTTSAASRMYADPDHARPLERSEDGWRECRLRKTDRTMHAAGGLATSAHDAARWLILHLEDGEIDGARVISAARAREMRTLRSRFPEKDGSIRIMEGFGLSWQVGTFHGAPLCAHGGDYPGAMAYYAMLPEQGAGFAVLMNTRSRTAKWLQDAIAVDILDRLIEGDERIDVLETYRQGLENQKRRDADAASVLKAAMAAPLELSRPVGAYAGRFENADLGTITVSPDGARLKVEMGECGLDVASAGPDALKVLAPTLEGLVLKFVVTPDGGVTGVSVDLSDAGVFLFGR